MMSFLAILTKEMRLRLRRERTIWVIVAYLTFMGALGWLAISRYTSPTNFTTNTLSNAGGTLYLLLAQLQLLLILFITPAFTATAINSEKERQTFDLLLCSRLSSLSLVAGKLLAGLANALLLIIASAPLFSLVFFFGGISPMQVLQTLLVFIMTTVVVGTFGLFCSTIFKRPAISTAIAYLGCIIWLGMPLLINVIAIAFNPPNTNLTAKVITTNQVATPYSLPAWAVSNPLAGLAYANPGLRDTYSAFNLYNYIPVAIPSFNVYSVQSISVASSGSLSTPVIVGGTTTPSATTELLGIAFTPLNAFYVCGISATVLFFLLSMLVTKPGSLRVLIKRIESTLKARNKADLTLVDLDEDKITARA
jgi:ABC-type transport system involved in multi-copper enzyme maturation permease subunit